ncbi:MAG: metallophosphoesterase family protein [Gemmatimonadaceae bacterium]
MLIGLISDTHGLLRPEVHAAFAGVELILHAGDVCGDEILDELALVAPVRAVYGNNDAPWDPRLAPAIDDTWGGVRVHVSHGHEVGKVTPANLAAAYDADVVVYGHTHVQKITRAGARLIVNPGAAGPRRFNLQPSVALLTVADGAADVVIVPLTP